MSDIESIFKEVQVERVSQKITRQIISLISDNKLNPGDKLPSEAKLMELFGVGRSSLREALVVLETTGYIDIRRREGYFVKITDSSMLLDPLKSIFKKDQKKICHLYEIRRDIERSSAFLAAERRTEADIVAIRKWVEIMKSESGRYRWLSDKNFHIAIANASHNFLRSHILQHIFDFSKEFLEQPIEDMLHDLGGKSQINQQHENIIRSIEDGDAKMASKYMRDHLDWTNKNLVSYLD